MSPFLQSRNNYRVSRRQRQRASRSKCRGLFDALCEFVEILWAFLADRLYSPRSFLAQRFATAVGEDPQDHYVEQ